MSGGTTDDKTGFQVERLAFFSDAVFAIAITLLALEIRVPPLHGEVTEKALLQGLLRTVPGIVGFVVSFLVVGIYWRAHHRLFRWVRMHDEKLVSLNMRLLLCVSFIPFPTAFFSEYPDHRTPLIFYCVCLALVGLANYGLWRYLARNPALLAPSTPQIEFHLTGRRSLVIPVIFGVAILFSFVNLWFARLMMLAAPLVIPAYTRYLRRAS